MAMSDENSASSLFAGQPHSCVFDAKSGCQLSDDSVKLVVWFDNEHGFAYRIVDLITQTHAAYCSQHSDWKYFRKCIICYFIVNQTIFVLNVTYFMPQARNKIFIIYVCCIYLFGDSKIIVYQVIIEIIVAFI